MNRPGLGGDEAYNFRSMSLETFRFLWNGSIENIFSRLSAQDSFQRNHPIDIRKMIQKTINF
jgi:hypothetical protein